MGDGGIGVQRHPLAFSPDSQPLQNNSVTNPPSEPQLSVQMSGSCQWELHGMLLNMEKIEMACYHANVAPLDACPEREHPRVHILHLCLGKMFAQAGLLDLQIETLSPLSCAVGRIHS